MVTTWFCPFIIIIIIISAVYIARFLSVESTTAWTDAALIYYMFRQFATFVAQQHCCDGFHTMVLAIWEY